MKKLFAMLLALALVFSLAACGDTNTPASGGGTTSSSQQEEENTGLSGQVSLGGSTSMEKVVKALMEAFNQTCPNVSLTYDMTGSGSGISGATEGALDIGLSSRALKEDETGVQAITIALDGIAIIVNTENPVTDLTMEQIAAIAKGEIKNWSEVGGSDAEIVLVGREASSGTRDGFESIVGVEDQCDYAQELNATGAVVAAVHSNANAIGYASLASVGDTVKAVTVDGVACTEETVKDGVYPIQRPFNFIVKDENNLSQAAKAFLDFARSAEGAKMIQAGDAVPVN